MRREEAKEQIIRNPQEYLQRDNSKKGYICPICGSGSGAKGTGITSKDKIHFTCWTGCFTNSDIIDIIGLEYGIDAYIDKFEKACELYNIDFDSLEKDYSFISACKDFADEFNKHTDNTYNTHNKQEEPAPDYIAYFKERATHIKECDYLIKRGLSEELLATFLIGYDPQWRSPKALKNGSNPPATPRVIIPTSRGSYIARDVRENLTDVEKQFSKMKEGALSLFNLKALEQNKLPVFVVEGEIDALSFEEIGFKAVALGSTTNYKKLLDKLKEKAPATPIIVALDNDESGKKTSEKLLKGLLELNIECYDASFIYTGECKDANELLVKDREAFKLAVDNALERCKEAQDLEKEAYLRTSTSNYVDAFINGIAESVNTPYIPTGFFRLDMTLDGGLYEGLYIVGAISSLGKTTLVLQIADQIAKAGNDVLIFSLEMARNELIAKSISRATAEICISEKRPIELAKTTRGITVYNFYKKYSEEERELIARATEEYKELANNIYISEGIGDISVVDIREAVKKHISITGKKPVVVIDYLQILAPPVDEEKPNRSYTDKQATDSNVTALKRLSRDYKLPIIGISSFNRDNYNVGVNMTAFKESGSIEYSSDVLIGLQLAGAGTSSFDVDEAKRKNPRQVELKILKNRSGKTGDVLKFDYYPQYNYFTPNDKTLEEYEKSHKEPPKMTKRGKQEFSLEEAFNRTELGGRTTVKDMAEFLDITSSSRVRAMIKEYGGFTIEAGTGVVTRDEFKPAGNTPFN